MIDVIFSPLCTEIMDILEVPPDLVVTTINDRHRGLVSRGFDRITAVHWFSDEQIVLAETTVSKREFEKESKRMYFRQVTAQLAIELSSDLPSGTIDRSMDMEEILAVVADSFGCPVSCHHKEAPSKLYTGRWNGRVDVKGSGGGSMFCLIGSFNKKEMTCELVWAFNLDEYRKWFVRS